MSSGILFGALAAGVLATLSLNSAGTANASCASLNGFNIGSGCHTTDFGDFALGIGNVSNVSASGGFNTAIAVGNGANAFSSGRLNVAVAAGTDASARATGTLNQSVAIGNRGNNVYYGANDYTYARTSGSMNAAYAIGNGNTALVTSGNLNPLNGPGLSTAIAVGSGNAASARNGSLKVGIAGGYRQKALNGVNNGSYP
ncbi:hypothetical protein FHT40_002833 [Mycolicibacterium sp. BK556]|uniref:hypothetical protein n=1 Tax=unclassified Mycolicibacterium TaxID=2636767 RepID=UPI00160F51F8|nr:MULTISPECIES: hypothetical protein [unclassified Mycolicibacterium]MBB3603172.1 hypothetical protein [Mycolicibacterium sp. BK556]MBB3633367.1 hypothetical protein [Mycolicibacterium sp. BK607]MBB3750940.1 hypothetical protein [Mycolicibacterium sp. BK634]